MHIQNYFFILKPTTDFYLLPVMVLIYNIVLKNYHLISK